MLLKGHIPHKLFKKSHGITFRILQASGVSVGLATSYNYTASLTSKANGNVLYEMASDPITAGLRVLLKDAFGDIVSMNPAEI